MDEAPVQPQENTQQPKQLPFAAKILCTDCKTEMMVQIPRPRIFNAIDISSIAFAHERLPQCPKCKAVFTLTLQMNEVGLVIFMWNRIQAGQPTILEGTQHNLNEALATNDLADKIKLN